MKDPEYQMYHDIVMNLCQRTRSFPSLKFTIDPICNQLMPRYMRLQDIEDERLGVPGGYKVHED